MRRTVALAFFLCSITTIAFAQSRLNGKWATDRPADPVERRQSDQVQLEVTIEDAKASGSVAIGGLGGTFYTFKDRTLSGNKIQFQPDPGPYARTWTIELVDDNTVTLSRGQLPLVGTNVLDLIAVMGAMNQRTAPAPQPTPQSAANALLSGVVQDSSKALIPGVTVTATNVDTNATLTTITDQAGRYSFPTATAGKYTLAASLRGFQTKTLSDLSLGDTPLKQDFTLQVLGAQASAEASDGLCSRYGPNRIDWCTILHRAK